jgi:hypothetical protein
MALGYKTGGRQKGTPNRNRVALLEKLATAFPEYDPLLALAELAQDDEVDLSVRLDCHKTLATYLYPKMRSVDCVQDHELVPITVEIVNPQ